MMLEQVIGSIGLESSLATCHTALPAAFSRTNPLSGSQPSPYFWRVGQRLILPDIRDHSRDGEIALAMISTISMTLSFPRSSLGSVRRPFLRLSLHAGHPDTMISAPTARA